MRNKTDQHWNIFFILGAIAFIIGILIPVHSPISNETKVKVTTISPKPDKTHIVIVTKPTPADEIKAHGGMLPSSEDEPTNAFGKLNPYTNPGPSSVFDDRFMQYCLRKGMTREQVNAFRNEVKKEFDAIYIQTQRDS